MRALESSAVCLQTTGDLIGDHRPSENITCKAGTSTPVSLPLAKLTLICLLLALSKAFSSVQMWLRRLPATISSWSFRALPQIKPLSLTLSTSSRSRPSDTPEAVHLPTLLDMRRTSIVLPTQPSRQESGCILTTPSRDLGHGVSDALSGSPEVNFHQTSKTMRGQSREFLATLRRRHGLGEFRGRAKSARRGKNVKNRPKSSKTRVKKMRSSPGKLGLGM